MKKRYQRVLSFLLIYICFSQCIAFANQLTVQEETEIQEEDPAYVPQITVDDTVRSSMLHVEGNRIYNEEGEEVRLIGACIPSMEWGKGEKTLETTVKMFLDNWNGNIIRLPLSQKFWNGNEWYVEDGGNAYRRRVERIVNMVAARGKYVLLDLHEYKIPDETSVYFWKEVSSMYKNHPAVLFDILNEPYGVTWQQWKYGGPVVGQSGKNIISPGMQGLVDVIRQNGAKNIIVAGGLDYAYDDRGIAKGYDGLENGYALDEGEGEYKGNGIMYSAHIYPWKMEEEDWEDKVGCIMRDYPIFVGEFGHTNEKVAKFWDNGYYEDSSIWCNQILNWMDYNGLNYSTWAVHTNTAPEAIRNWDYEPTPFSGIYQKYNMSRQKDVRPEKPEITDKYPMSTEKYIMDFDEVDAEWGVYKSNPDEYFATASAEGRDGSKGRIIAFDGTAASAGAIAELPKEWKLDGISYVAVDVKGDGDIRNLGMGLELKDGRQFKKVFPINMYQGWQTMFFPIENLKGNYGVFDPTQIKSVFFTNETDGKGSYTIDNFEIGCLPYTPQKDTHYVEDFESSGTTKWEAWGDTETTDFDAFTTQWVEKEGYGGTGGRKFWFCRPERSYGGQAYMDIPADWDLSDMTHISFKIKSSKDMNLLLRLGTKRTKAERSGFERRDFERFCHPFTTKAGEWITITMRISEFGISETLEKDYLRFLDIFNMDEDSKGWFILDDLTFSNRPLPEDSPHTEHPTPQPSESLTSPLPRQYADGIMFQKAVGSCTFRRGQEAKLKIQVHNTTDETQSGTLKLTGLPEGFTQKDENSTIGYKVYSRYKTNKTVYFDISENVKPGEYTFTIQDSNADSMLKPCIYTITVTD